MLPKILSTLFLIVTVLLLPTVTLADTFEFLTFTPPTRWSRQTTTDGIVYRRPYGIGLISFYTSQAATGTPEQEFAKMWGEKIEKPLSLKAPQPKIESDGSYKVAVGAQNVDAQGTTTAISLVVMVGKGRVIGISTVAAGDDALNEVMGFLDTVDIGKTTTTSGGASTTTSNTTNSVDVDFDVPAGYTSSRDGNVVVLKPNVVDRNTPCIYGISPSRPSRGSLETDARAALLEPLPGWQVKSDHYNAMRGMSGGGWQYYWLRTDVQQMSGSSMQYLTAMAMAFPSGPGRVSIFWGFGATGPCSVDDQSFLRIFFSLRPRGLTSDGGKALAKELHGLWRDTQSSGMAQYKFSPSGQYEYGLGTSTTFGNLETTTGGVGDGRWQLTGSELTLTGKRAGKYQVRVYDEFLAGVWRRAVSLLNTSTKLDVQYMRIN